MKVLRGFFVVASVLFTLSCSKKDDSSYTVTESSADQVGDVMASIDETGGQNGAFAMMSRESSMFAKMSPDSMKDSKLTSLIFPRAQAASCSLDATWGNCSSNKITRTFSDCTLGGATFSGTVTLDFDDGNINNVCTVDSDGDSISRSPDFTITGLGGGQFTVSKTGTYGQKVTRTSNGVFTFTNDGVRRVVSYKGTTLADYTTVTTSALNVTGSVRNGRVVNGGTLRVTNNLTSATCDFSPSNVTWGSSCNCPTSGSWSTTCSDGKSGSIAITGCGSGTFTLNGEQKSVSFDRCSSL